MSVTIKTLDASNDPEIKYWPVVLELIGCYQGEVEELFNAGLVGVMEAYRTWDSERGSLATWTHWCVRRNMVAESLNYKRSLRRFNRCPAGGGDISEYLECLPSALRKMFLMYYVEGRSQNEIGEYLGLSKQRISQLMADGIRRMARET